MFGMDRLHRDQWITIAGQWACVIVLGGIISRAAPSAGIPFAERMEPGPAPPPPTPRAIPQLQHAFEELAGASVGGSGEDGLGRAHFDDLPFEHEGNPIGGFTCETDLMCNHHHRHALAG
jgi:hypothetical protein